MDLLKNYVGGRWVESASGQTYQRTNPATGELVATSTRGTPADVDAAVAAAKEAFRSWRLYPAPKRGVPLFTVARLLEERKERLAREMTEEMGKVIEEARGDVQEAIERFYSQCAVAHAIDLGLRQPPAGRHARRRGRSPSTTVVPAQQR